MFRVMLFARMNIINEKHFIMMGQTRKFQALIKSRLCIDKKINLPI